MWTSHYGTLKAHWNPLKRGIHSHWNSEKSERFQLDNVHFSNRAWTSASRRDVMWRRPSLSRGGPPARYSPSLDCLVGPLGRSVWQAHAHGQPDLVLESAAVSAKL